MNEPTELKTPREITSHKVNPANDTLNISVTDEPGAGGACHEYLISGFKRPCTINFRGEEIMAVQDSLEIVFQNGPIAENGVNGITQEALIAICIDRLESFQAGPYACNDNACALYNLKQAQAWLQKRTRDRMARGVEGTHKL